MENKTLVLYIFHTYNKRVKFFINNAIFYKDNIDFILICNNKSIDFDCPGYVKKFLRDNIGYDFGGWSDALLTNNLYKKYEYFIFANSSIDGPYLNEDYKGNWVDIYINGLQTCNLFGSTINIGNQNAYTFAHVQSYIFSMNKDTLKYLIECNIFNNNNYIETFNNAVQNEIMMSRKIIDNNWNIGSLLSLYKDVDFRSKLQCDSLPLIDRDLMNKRNRNKYWNEYDLVFIKGNRCMIRKY